MPKRRGARSLRAKVATVARAQSLMPIVPRTQLGHGEVGSASVASRTAAIIGSGIVRDTVVLAAPALSHCESHPHPPEVHPIEVPLDVTHTVEGPLDPGSLDVAVAEEVLLHDHLARHGQRQ